MKDFLDPAPLSPGETTAVTEDGILAAAREMQREEDSETPAEKEAEQLEEREFPYSIFRPWEKWFIVGMTSLAGVFSPLSANIYFPSIPVLSAAFGQPTENINLTVTIYMILQGISPVLWGSLADSPLCGRRPVYLSCLLLFSLSNIGLALTPTSAFWLLMVLRCFQAAGCASVVALGAGTIMDIAARAERGTFLGVSALGPMVGPCVGPVAGGLLAGNLGWRWVFWFLCISSGATLLVEFIFLPETLRAIVGDGSIPPPRLNRPIIPILGRGRKHLTEVDPKPPPEASAHTHTPLDVLRLLLNPDLALILFGTAIPYSVFYSVTTSTSAVFLAVYPSLSESDLGLCFLANGAGNLLGSIVAGRVLDWEYAYLRKKVKARGGDLSRDGPSIEHARLSSSPYYWGFFVLSIVAYGWCASARLHIAVLLVLQFFVGIFMAGIFTMNQTLLMDLFPGRGASITACNNLVRCLTGSIFVSVINFVIDAIGPGWTFTILGGTCVAYYPFVILEWRRGPVWRKRREERISRGGHD